MQGAPGLRPERRDKNAEAFIIVAIAEIQGYGES
jgi:hypothetical protein